MRLQMMAALASDRKFNHDRATIFNTEYEVETNYHNMSECVMTDSSLSLCDFLNFTEIRTKVRFVSESTDSTAPFLLPLQRVCSAEKCFSKLDEIYVFSFHLSIILFLFRMYTSNLLYL